MADLIDKVLQTFPPRPLTDGERQLVIDWTQAAEEFSAFVSERRVDDPMIFRRIVVSRRRTKQHLYLIHSPIGQDCWIMVSATEGECVGRFPMLRAALDHLCPVMHPVPVA